MPTNPSQPIAFSRVSTSARLTLPCCDGQRAEVLARLVLHGHHHVLQARQAVEQAHVLERADHALAGDAVGVEADELVAVEEDRARVGRDGPGEQVEHRRLAGAVRADQGGDRALAQLDGELAGGDDAAEALADTFDVCSTTGASCHARSRRFSSATSAARRRCARRRCAPWPAPSRRPSRRGSCRRVRRGPTAISENPSGRAPCGRSRIRMASSEAVDDELHDAGVGRHRS